MRNQEPIHSSGEQGGEFSATGEGESMPFEVAYMLQHIYC